MSEDSGVVSGRLIDSSWLSISVLGGGGGVAVGMLAIICVS